MAQRDLKPAETLPCEQSVQASTATQYQKLKC